MALSVGVDVLEKVLVVAVSPDGTFVPPAEFIDSAESLRKRILEIRQSDEAIVVSIDAPRRYLSTRRRWRLNDKGRWVPLPTKEKGYGRHCDILVRRLNLADPIWTPVASDPQPWITFGQKVFAVCEAEGFVTIECFPSASYRCLGQLSRHSLVIPGEMFKNVCTGSYTYIPHIFDACVAAYTADLFQAANATELGGGDGYGTIVVPGHVHDYNPRYTPEHCPPFPSDETSDRENLVSAEDATPAPEGAPPVEELAVTTAMVPKQGEMEITSEAIDALVPNPASAAQSPQLGRAVPSPPVAPIQTTGCPHCGRRIGGLPGTRYCIVCEQQF